MPEGPSIVILKEQAARFAGQRIVEVSGNSRQDLQRMHGLQVLAICSWGKHFLLAFDGFALRIHFLLFGSSRIDDPKPDVAPRLLLRDLPEALPLGAIAAGARDAAGTGRWR